MLVLTTDTHHLNLQGTTLAVVNVSRMFREYLEIHQVIRRTAFNVPNLEKSLRFRFRAVSAASPKESPMHNANLEILVLK